MKNNRQQNIFPSNDMSSIRKHIFLKPGILLLLNYEMEFDRLSILNLPFWPSTGGKLTKLNIPEGSFELTTQREGAAFCGNLFFHTKNDCCSLEGTCKPVTSS